MLLAADGQSVSTDRLIDAVWGTDPSPSVRKSLQSHIARLRGQLRTLSPDEPDPLVTEADGYRIDLETHELDARELVALLERARVVQREDPQQALALLEKAGACWQGQAFGDLASHRGVRSAAQHLEQLRSAATADRIDAWLDEARHEEALAELRRLVEQDPFDERAHGQLMRALVLGGRQVEAWPSSANCRDASVTSSG